MDIIENKYFEQLKTFIENHNFFLIAGHKDPDGDCIASNMGIAAIVEHFGKEYQLLSAGPFKRNEIAKFQKKYTNKIAFLDESDRKKTGLIITDCSEIQRLGEIDGDLTGLDTFIIDHHKTAGLPENAEGYINADAPACAYLVQLFYENIVGPVPEKIAKILFFGIGTDTGYFRFLTSDKKESIDLFMAAARLVSYGANPRLIYNEINYGKPYSTRKLLGILLDKAETYHNGKLIVTYETMEDTKNHGIEGRDSDALYSLLLSVKDVEAVAFIRQDTPTTCTAGLRSIDRVDVSAVAAKFGGGGHKNASGLSTDGVLDKLIPEIVKEFGKVL